MPTNLRRTAFAALAVAPLTLVGACGSNDSSTTATDSTSSVSGLKPGAAVSVDDAHSLLASATGDLTSMKFSADVSLGSAATMHMEGVEQVKPSVAAQVSATVSGQQMDLRMIGTSMYMQLPPAAAAQLPGGKKWMSMDFAEIGQLTGMDTSGLSDTLQNPAGSLDKYAKYVTGGTYVGPATVDGVDTKQYDFTLDVKGAMSAMMPSGLPSTGVTVPDSMKESIWIDGDHRPVQMKMEMGKLGTTTMHMSDFGTKVDVTAPPKAETVDMATLMKSAGKAS